jgi:hypothetical protein
MRDVTIKQNQPIYFDQTTQTISASNDGKGKLVKATIVDANPGDGGFKLGEDAVLITPGKDGKITEESFLNRNEVMQQTGIKKDDIIPTASTTKSQRDNSSLSEKVIHIIRHPLDAIKIGTYFSLDIPTPAQHGALDHIKDLQAQAVDV